jgi:hypothetical protein
MANNLGYVTVSKNNCGRLDLENGLQYLPPISVELSSKKIYICNNINGIVYNDWKI